MPEHLRFSEHLIMENYSYAFGISAVDINGNGNIDLVSADAHRGLYWFENDGKGNFTHHIIHNAKHPSIVASKRVVMGSKGPRGNEPDPYTFERYERHEIGDMNGDGHPDVVIVDNASASVLWFENSGHPADKPWWEMHFISEGGLWGAYDVALADFDGDGDVDVAASSWVGGRFVWFENRNGSWIQHVIEENMGETRTICAADFNGDGKMDLLGTATLGGQVVWYENSGNPVRDGWKKHVIDTAYCPIHGHPVDMDGDGNLDVVMALSTRRKDRIGANQIVWYENGGEPDKTPWKKHVICESFENAFEAVAADLDGDGNMEVLATAWGPTGRIVLFKHQGDPKGAWSMQLLKDGWQNANQVLVADLNGNGKLDVAAVAERGSNDLRWWRNEG